MTVRLGLLVVIIVHQTAELALDAGNSAVDKIHCVNSGHVTFLCWHHIATIPFPIAALARR